MAGGFAVRVARHEVWSWIPAIDTYGDWTEAELSLHEYDGTRLLVYGHCLLDAKRRSTGFADAINAGRLATSASAVDPEAIVARVAEWPGSYSAIVVRGEGVAACADRAGQFPLYYSAVDDEVVVGSDPALPAIWHARDPDPVTLAAHIACPAVFPLWWGRAPYRDIWRLEGGTMLHVKAGVCRVDMARLPLPVPGRSLSEGADLLRSTLTAAVRDRCRERPVSSDFSGGVDSTTIAFLAAHYSPRPVTAIAYHQPLAPAGDLDEARRFHSLDQGVDLRVIRGTEEDLPFADLGGPTGAVPGWPFDRIPVPEPEPGMLAARRTLLRLAVAQASGSEIHLTGEGGDAVLQAPPSYLASLAHLRSARTLLRHCGGYARLRYTGPVRLTGRAIRLPGINPGRALKALAAELDHPVALAPRWADLVSWWPPAGEAATWLSARIRGHLASIAADPSTARIVPDGVGPAELSSLVDLRRSGDAQRHVRELASALGLPVHAPFLDNAVIQAGLSVPGENRANPWAYKPMLRESMARLVPEEVLSRRTKGDYSSEDYRGARNALPTIRGLLTDSLLADLGVIEPAAVQSALDRMADGVAVPLGPLNMLLATEAWLRGRREIRTGAATSC